MCALLDATCNVTDAANKRADAAMKRVTTAEKLVIAVMESAAATAYLVSVKVSGDTCAAAAAAHNRTKVNEEAALADWKAATTAFVAANAAWRPILYPACIMSADLFFRIRRVDAANNRAATAMKRATTAEKLVIAVTESATKHTAYLFTKANEKLALDAWLASKANEKLALDAWLAVIAEEDE